MRPLVFWALLLWGCIVACLSESPSSSTTTPTATGVRRRISRKITQREILRGTHHQATEVGIEELSRRARAEKITLSDEAATATEAQESSPAPVVTSKQDAEQQATGVSVDTKIGIGIGGAVAGIVLLGGILYVWTGRRQKELEPMTQTSWHSYYQHHHLRHESLVGLRRAGAEFTNRPETLKSSRRASEASDFSKPPPAKFPDGYGGWPVELPVEVHR